jgi:hypothetical protein
MVTTLGAKIGLGFNKISHLVARQICAVQIDLTRHTAIYARAYPAPDSVLPYRPALAQPVHLWPIAGRCAFAVFLDMCLGIDGFSDQGAVITI